MTSLSLPIRAPRLMNAVGGRGLLRGLRRTPFTWALVATLLVTTIVLRHLVAAQALDVMRWASTNIANLTHAPVRAFVASALVLPDQVWWPSALGLLLSLGFLERRLGTLRAIAVFVSGHVIATILSEGAVWYWYGVHEGGLPETIRDQLDVGVSYGLWVCVAAAVFFIPGRLRWLFAAGVSIYMLVSLALDPGMTASGHVLATAIGFAWWGYFAHRVRSSPAQPTPQLTTQVS